MQAKKKKINEWAALMQYGDLKQIATKLGLGTQWTRAILTTGKGSVEQIAAIDVYFEPRKKLKNKVK
jgi:hypothetical protein